MASIFFRWGSLAVAWGLLVPAAVLYAVYLYRRQPVLSNTRRTALGILRAGVYTVLILLLFEPVVAVTSIITTAGNVLVLLDVSASMAIRDHRRLPQELLDAATAMGKYPLEDQSKGSPTSPTMPPSGAPVDLSADVRAEVDNLPRLALAKGILRLPQLDFLQNPAANLHVSWYCFGEKVEPMADEKSEQGDWLDAIEASAKATRLGDGVLEAVEQHSGQPITAVVVLSDGASNEGADPLEAARRLRERAIPIHTIAVGLPEPDGVRIQTVLVPDTVFCEDKVPVRVLLQSHGFQGRTAELSLKLDGRVVAARTIELGGGTQFEELSFIADRKGGESHLTVEVSPPPGDAAPENNRVERTLTVIDEKIKILYVEGKPRWEYRYLRGILTRDHRLDVKFLLSEGDRDLANASPQYLDRFPEQAAAAFRYDLVIVGDVPASFFTAAQLARIEQLVAQHGGSLLMLAGHEHAPMSYQGSPLAALLPVRLADGRDRVDPALHPLPTEAGRISLMLALDPSAERTREAWAQVRPLFDLPRLAGLKPGATLLATLSDNQQRGEPYPLIAWQRYGTGKTLYVGTDQLWRLRAIRGDEYHSRFWKQAIQFLTLSRLLGENRRIRLETDQRAYRGGERVQIYASVLNEFFEPVERLSYTVLVELPGQAEPTVVTLERNPGSPGLYRGFLTAEKPGRYLLKAVPEDKSLSNAAAFQVVAADRELLEPAVQEQTLRKMAELSGGQYLSVRDLPKLRELLNAKPRTAVISQEISLWDRWYVFVFLLGSLATEWFVRRRDDAA